MSLYGDKCMVCNETKYPQMDLGICTDCRAKGYRNHPDANQWHLYVKPLDILDRIAATQSDVDTLVSEIRMYYKPTKDDPDEWTPDAIHDTGLKQYYQVKQWFNLPLNMISPLFLKVAYLCIEHGVLVRKDGTQ